jgi:uncharacterized membrane protein (DUF4010 family)
MNSRRPVNYDVRRLLLRNRMTSETLKPEQPKYALLGTVVFGVCLRPVTWLLEHFLSLPLAFALAVLALSLLTYPLAFRGGYRPWFWQRNWTFRHFVLFDVAISIGAFFLARALVPNR